MNRYLEKIAGNRLIRHIAENRENFPMSRLLRMAEEGLIKSPEQLLPGRNLGAKAQFEQTAKKYDMKPIEGEMSTLFMPTNTAVVQRQYLNNGKYLSESGLANGRPFQQTAVPPLYAPVPGDNIANIRRLHDTHVNNHETFEMDEAFRMMGSGKTRTLMGQTYPTERFRAETHHNPAVLLRESRDMSSNPYAHIVPPSTDIGDYRRLVSEAKKRGIKEQVLATERRVSPMDVSSSLPSSREFSGEAGLVRHLQGGTPYQANPTSSQIRRARNITHEESQQVLDNIKGGVFNKAKRAAALTNDTTRGNKAYRS